MIRINRNRDGVLLFSFGTLSMGLVFLWVSLTGGIPMPEETHGHAVYILPAELWAGVVIAHSALIIFGVLYAKVWAVLSGSLLSCIVYTLFFELAHAADFGFITATGAGFVFAPLSAAIFVAASLDAFCLKLQKDIKEKMGAH